MFAPEVPYYGKNRLLIVCTAMGTKENSLESLSIIKNKYLLDFQAVLTI